MRRAHNAAKRCRADFNRNLNLGCANMLLKFLNVLCSTQLDSVGRELYVLMASCSCYDLFPAFDTMNFADLSDA